MAYISKIKVPGVESTVYLIKDSEGRLMIAPEYDSSTSYSAGDYYVKDGKFYVVRTTESGTTGIETTVSAELQSIKQSIAGAMHYIGVTDTPLTDGAKKEDFPTLVPHSEGSLTKTTGFVSGDVVLAPASDKTAEKYYEYVFNGDVWSEFGSTKPIGQMAYANEAKGINTIEYEVPVYTGGTISINEYSGNDESAVYIKPISVVGSVEVGTTTSASSVTKKNKYLSTKLIKISGDSGTAMTGFSNTYRKLGTTSIYGVDENTVDASKVIDGEELIRVGATAKTTVVTSLGATADASGDNPFVGAKIEDECLSWIEKPLGTTEIREAFNENITVQKVGITSVTGIAKKAQTGTTVATGSLVNSNYNVNHDNKWDKDSIVCDLYGNWDLFQKFSFDDASHTMVATGQLSDTGTGANIADAIEVTQVNGLVTGLSVKNKDNVLQKVGSGETGATGLLTGLKSSVREFQVPVVKNGNETYSVDTEINVRPNPEPESKYLTMTIPEGSPETQISINKKGTPIGTNFQYRVNYGKWTDWDFTNPQAISANANDVIQWKGVNPSGISKDYNNYIYFDIPNEVHLSGNVMSLIDGVGDIKVIPCSYCFFGLFQGTKIKTVTKDFLPSTTLTEGCYNSMFQGCTSLTTAPALPATVLAEYCYCDMFYECTSLATAPALHATTLVEGCYSYMFEECSKLVNAPALPSTTLSDNCYYKMFSGCSSLVNAPALPATVLAGSCYGYMFNGCTSLTTAPELPATTLAEYCYEGMFSGCSSLINAPVLPSTTLADSCYSSMFYGCTSLTTAPELPDTILAGNCYNEMFRGCTSLTTAPALPATVLAEYCYCDMFYECTSLATAPELPATTLTNSCYYRMFQGCSNLNKVTCLATNISAEDCTSDWLSGVASTGTFNKAAGVTWTTGVSGIPSGWTVNEPSKYLTMTVGSTATQISINKSGEPVGTNIKYRVNDGEWTDWNFTNPPAISAKANDVIQWKGNNPNGLSTDESNYIYFDIPNEVDLSGNVMSLIDGVGDTKVIPCIGCFCNLFKNTKIKTVTEDFLPATTLANGCYSGMFSGCTLLATAPALPATTLAGGCYMAMFDGCSKLVNTPALPATTIAFSCYMGMFAMCTSLENVPELPAETLAPYCYGMMFVGCSSLVNAPALPATVLAGSCYGYMFSGCTSLVTAPALPATILTEGCYQGMFNGCSNLQHVTCLATDISATDCTSSWLSGVASTGTFNKAADIEWSTGVNGIPEGWTIIEPPKYLTMTLPEGSPETQISIKKQGEPVGTNIQYRVNNGNWTDWNFTNSQAISANAGNVIQFKGNNPNGLSIGTNEYPGYSENYVYFDIPNEVNLSGNVMSLIDGDGKTKVIPCIGCFCNLFKNTKIKTVTEDFLPATTLAGGCYSYMFQGCSSLENTPALPATKIAEWCYTGMFGSCSSLITAPALPATTLADFCYASIFNGCTSLTTAPALPATTLAPFCYQWMFDGCTSLVNAPALSARILKDFCYRCMFQGCSSLKNAPEILPAKTLEVSCYDNMFNGCTSLATAPALSATTLAENCCAAMFYGCTSLTTAPALNATTLVKSCYINMFNGCSNLKKVTCLATNIPSVTCTNGWLRNVASTGTFVKASGFNGWKSGVDGIPEGWTAIEPGQTTGPTGATVEQGAEAIDEPP